MSVYFVAAGSEEERAAFDRAYAHGRKAPYHDKFVIEEEGAVTVDITPASEDVAIGSDVNVAIKVKLQKKICCYCGFPVI